MNPCDLCEAKNKASACFGCVLYEYETNCENYECFVNSEGACLLSLAEVCKASTNYKDDLAMHDCSECENFRECKDGMMACAITGEEVGSCDVACENFKEDEA